MLLMWDLVKEWIFNGQMKSTENRPFAEFDCRISLIFHKKIIIFGTAYVRLWQINERGNIFIFSKIRPLFSESSLGQFISGMRSRFQIFVLF